MVDALDSKSSEETHGSSTLPSGTKIMNEEFMLLAIEEAKQAKIAGDLPFGAVVISNGEVISKGRAKNNTTGTVIEHAELLAVNDACKKLKRNSLKDCTIYCTNEPCIMCAAAIFQADIGYVVIGAMRSDLPNLLRPRSINIDALAKDSGHAIEITKGVLKDQILELFSGIEK